jgi:hypothetical protein
MKTVLPLVLLCFCYATIAAAQEPAKAKIAVVRVNVVMAGSSNLYEKMRQLYRCDKETREAIKKINTDLKALGKEVADTDDEAKVADLSRKAQFLQQKLSLLRQCGTNVNQNIDMNAIIRDFIVNTFKGKYQLILQQDSGGSDRAFLWKGNADVDDITDEAGQKFREYLDQSLGE